MTAPVTLPATPTPVTGWFGKVPARGDFVCHGLPAAWVGPWDACLQQVLRLADAQGVRRLQFAPLRFLAWPQGADGSAWAGVLVPSHDRVGRVFPLTVVQRLGAGWRWPPGRDGLGGRAVEAGLARLADAALDVTDTADPVLMEDFVGVLSGVGPVIAATSGAAGGAVEAGVSLWWAPPTPGVTPRPARQPWPPDPAWLLALVVSAVPDHPAAASTFPATPVPAPHTPS